MKLQVKQLVRVDVVHFYRLSGTFNCSRFSNNSLNMATLLLQQYRYLSIIIYYSTETCLPSTGNASIGTYLVGKVS